MVFNYIRIIPHKLRNSRRKDGFDLKSIKELERRYKKDEREKVYDFAGSDEGAGQI